MTLAMAFMIVLRQHAREYWQEVRARQWDKAHRELDDNQPLEKPVRLAGPAPRNLKEQCLAAWRRRNGRARVPSNIRDLVVRN